MEYNGIKLKEVTESQIVDPPKKMLVWDHEYGTVLKADVLAIVNGRKYDYPVITTSGLFRHCAEIPEELKPRRATNRELSKWLGQGNGECGNGYDDLLKANLVSSTYTYRDIESDSAVPTCIIVRKWEDADWHEPTVDYMGIEY